MEGDLINQKTTTNFTDFLLRDELLKAIQEIGFEHPSEVQQRALPSAMMGIDLLCQAKSGTGKTAVFVLAVLHQMQTENGEIKEDTEQMFYAQPKTIVMCNTKELVVQIKEEFLRFTRHVDVKTEGIYGGICNEADEDRFFSRLLEGTNILVSTPGILFKLRKRIDFSKVGFFVVDEVDQVIENMRWEMQSIFTLCPKQKQTLLFSATVSEEIIRVSKLFFKKENLVLLIESNKLTLHGLSQFYLVTRQKNADLVRILEREDFNQAIVFVKDIKTCRYLKNFLKIKDHSSIDLNSSMPTEERKNRVMRFKELEFRILVTTNLLSRGIDILDVNLVVNYDIPECPETYLHRVGRAGRFETKGTAVTFVGGQSDMVMLNEVQGKFEVSMKEYLFE